MSPPFVIQIELPPEALGLIEKLKNFPGTVTLALKRALDYAVPLVAGHIQEHRLTGQGPFPVEEHRLGVVSGQLRQSVRWTEAIIEGSAVSATIGTPVRYAAVHEFGFDGVVNVRPFFRKFRGRDQFAKVERVSKKTGRKYRTSIKSASGVSSVAAHSRHMKIPARAPFGHGVADSEQLITNAVTSELETTWRQL